MNCADLPFSPACERNKQPIWETLCHVLPQSGTVLEIGSCSGQHVVYFASQRLELRWQPSDRPEYLPGLKRRLQLAKMDNIDTAIELDVLEQWPARVFDAVYSANTAHIMSWAAVGSMFRGVSQCLVSGGAFCLYGPFNEKGDYTAPSNAAFDAQLRRENPQMGLRDIEALELLALDQHMVRMRQFRLPANNQLLVFIKHASESETL